MPKYLHIGSYGQNQALWAHVGAKNGPKTADARPDSHYRDRIEIRTRPSYLRGQRVPLGRDTLHLRFDRIIVSEIQAPSL